MRDSTKQRIDLKHLFRFVFFLSCFVFCNQVQAQTSHTFLRPRSFSQNMALQYSMYNYAVYHMFRRDTKMPSFTSQTMTFYFKSTNRDSLRNYFLYDDNQMLRVEQNNTSNISSPQIEVVRPDGQEFKSFITIDPQRNVTGGAVGYFWNSGAGWVDFFAPVVHVQHDLNFSEQQMTGDGIVPGMANATAAFNNPNWQYGKLPTTAQTRTGIDDILVRVGYNTISDPYGYSHVSPYFFSNFPTGHQSNAINLFEATMGSGGHVGIGVGLNTDMWWWNYSLGQYCVFTDIRYGYYLKGEECRTFDLMNGPFTRYLQVADRCNPAARSPGTNKFTQCVDVTPGSTAQFIVGFHYAYANFHFEWGYNFWWRQRENISFRNDPLRNCVIYDIVGAICGNPTSSTFCNTNISQGVPGPGQPVSDPVVVPLQMSDLNIDSGAQPAAMTSTTYVSFGNDWFIVGVPNFFAVAFYYEFSHDRGSIEQVGGSVKYGFRF